MKANVLLTCVGGLVSPGIINNLRNSEIVNRIIGIDNSEDAIGFHFVDKFYHVPRGDEPNYIDVISSIVEKENINVIIPASDEEVISISRNKEYFEEKNVRLLCSPYSIIFSSIDKGSMLMFLEEEGVKVPNFSLPKTIDEVFEVAKKLGYPQKPVVAKPRRGRGGRGVKVLQENIDVLRERDSQHMKLEWYIEALKRETELELVIMEYLPGENYSVDVLAQDGDLVFAVPRKRLKAIGGPSQVGEVHWNEEVLDVVKEIVNKYGFNSNVNIQLKYSSDPYRGPLVYEINPRISGTIAVGRAAGVDLLSEGIKQTLGIRSSLQYRKTPEKIKMIRYLKEFFYK